MKKQSFVLAILVLSSLFWFGCASGPKYDLATFKTNYEALKAKPAVEPVRWLTDEEHAAAQADFDAALRTAVATLENSRVMPMLRHEYEKHQDLVVGLLNDLAIKPFFTYKSFWDDVKLKAPVVDEYLNKALFCLVKYQFIVGEVENAKKEAKHEEEKAQKSEGDKRNKHLKRAFPR